MQQNLCARSQGSHRSAAQGVQRRVSLDKHPGEITSIIGPSGCGKTTLFRIINRLAQADPGDVLVDGAPVAAPPAMYSFVF
jgi:ABC-type nitrate/sulfonate/bicarbonate transport system ATPase subunit